MTTIKPIEWQDIEGMPHYLSYYMPSLTLRIIQEGEYHVLQMLNFYGGGWVKLHQISISNETRDSIVQRLKDYANKILRLERF